SFQEEAVMTYKSQPTIRQLPYLRHSVILVAVIFFSVLAHASDMAQVNPMPLVNQPLVPAATAPSGAVFTLSVYGSVFVSGSVVNWNGCLRPTTLVNSSQLTAA